MQFSLRTLLAAVAVVGIGAALWVAEPSWQAGLAGLFAVLIIPAFSLVAIANTKRYAHTFFIGFFVPAICFAFFCVGTMTEHWWNGGRGETYLQWVHMLEGVSLHLHLYITAPVIFPIVGLCCVVMHRMFFAFDHCRPPQGPQE